MKVCPLIGLLLFSVITLKKIPVLHWTSKHEYNLKPKLITVFYLIFGLILFGIGETLLITAGIKFNLN